MPRKSQAKLSPPADAGPSANAAWGLLAIGRTAGIPGETDEQIIEKTRYLIGRGVFGDAVKRLGPKTYCGDIAKLSQFPANAILPAE